MPTSGETDFSVPQNRMTLKLRQGQVWKRGDEFIRIVRLERTGVGFKTFKDLKTGEGEHHRAGKKDFCRRLKSATLLAPTVAAKTSPPPAART